jgi:hypothetical protein
MVCYDLRVGLNILLLDEAFDIDTQLLMPSTKILQWQPGQNLQCKGVVPITTTIEGNKVCLEYYILHHPGPTFILVGVPLRTLLRGTDNGECLKKQVMATTLEEELSPPCQDDVADYFSLVEEEEEF